MISFIVVTPLCMYFIDANISEIIAHADIARIT